MAKGNIVNNTATPMPLSGSVGPLAHEGGKSTIERIGDDTPESALKPAREVSGSAYEGDKNSKGNVEQIGDSVPIPTVPDMRPIGPRAYPRAFEE